HRARSYQRLLREAPHERFDQIDGVRHRQRDLEDAEPTFEQGFDGTPRELRRAGAYHGHDAAKLDAFRNLCGIHLLILAPFPCMAASTSGSVAMEVSPGVDMASAPWVTPHCNAKAGLRPASNP